MHSFNVMHADIDADAVADVDHVRADLTSSKKKPSQCRVHHDEHEHISMSCASVSPVRVDLWYVVCGMWCVM